MKNHTEVIVAKLPKCDFCKEDAKVDGKTRMGPWANMCNEHFLMYSVGLGLRKGQKLVLKNPELLKWGAKDMNTIHEYIVKRRTSTVGNPMLVNLPAEDSKDYRDTKEGGMAFFLVVEQLEWPNRRQACIAGEIMLPKPSCIIKPLKLDRDNYIDAGLMIGSTGRSLWNEEKGRYFTPKVDDLTPEGKRLYHILKRLYGKISIVALLDT